MMKLIAAIVIALVGSFIDPGRAAERLIVTHSVRSSLSIGPLLYGIYKGFYRDEGIDLLYVSMRTDLGIKALLAGDVDYTYSAGTAIRAAVQGVPVKAISFDFDRVFHSLMARPEITSAAALKGKKVAVSSFGSSADVSARVALRALGLDPNRDVSIIALGEDSIRYAALQSGTVQATTMSLPLNIRLRKEGYRELVYVGKILQQPLTGFVTSRENIRRKPEQIQRIMRAFVRGMRAFKSDRADFVAFAQKKFSLPKDITEETYDYLIDSLTQDGFVESSVLEKAIDDAKKLVGSDKPVRPNDVVDYSFLRAALKN
jgi:NitT/TauT family transport system substrate-binding protein